MTIVRYADTPEQPWRNGRGVTREMYAATSAPTSRGSHVTAGGLHFRPMWRLSVATISEAGPFSAFPGMDRVFIVGEGVVELDVAGIRQVLRAGDLIRFSGETPVFAVPQQDSVIAVNFMAPRGDAAARVEVLRIDGPAPAADALVVLQGRVEVGDEAGVETAGDPEACSGGATLRTFDALIPVVSAICSDALVAVRRPLHH